MLLCWPCQESYVWKMYQERCWEFFPVGDCFRKQYEDQLVWNNLRGLKTKSVLIYAFGVANLPSVLCVFLLILDCGIFFLFKHKYLKITKLIGTKRMRTTCLCSHTTLVCDACIGSPVGGSYSFEWFVKTAAASVVMWLFLFHKSLSVTVKAGNRNSVWDFFFLLDVCHVFWINWFVF